MKRIAEPRHLWRVSRAPASIDGLIPITERGPFGFAAAPRGAREWTAALARKAWGNGRHDWGGGNARHESPSAAALVVGAMMMHGGCRMLQIPSDTASRGMTPTVCALIFADEDAHRERRQR